LRQLDLSHPQGLWRLWVQARLKPHPVGLLGLSLQLGLLDLLGLALSKLRLLHLSDLSHQSHLVDQLLQFRLECLAHLECLVGLLLQLHLLGQ
jgi:hypothetical protein